MSDSYESIPNSPGHHPGDTSEHEVNMSVRAQSPPDPSEQEEPASSLYQLTHHEGHGRYRVRAWTAKSEVEEPRGGYQERGRYTTNDDLVQALEDLPQQERYVVFENTDTGAVLYNRENNLSGNWTGGGQFNQVTLFASEGEAAAYAAQRQQELNDESQ